MISGLLLQTGLPSDPSTWEQFGPFAIVFVLMAAAIGWLLRERGIERTSHQAEIADRDARERVLYDRIIAQGEHFAPVLERTTWALEQTTKILDQSPPRGQT